MISILFLPIPHCIRRLSRQYEESLSKYDGPVLVGLKSHPPASANHQGDQWTQSPAVRAASAIPHSVHNFFTFVCVPLTLLLPTDFMME